MKKVEMGPLINGKTKLTGNIIEQVNPYTGEPIGRVHLSGDQEVEEALQIASKAYEEGLLELPTYRKIEILERAARLLEERKEEFTEWIVNEVAKPYYLAKGEVERGIVNIKSALSFVMNLRWESMPLDFHVPATGKFGVVKRFPVGTVIAITPFNFPLNLSLHKILPGIVAGTPIILKPPPQAPFTAINLGRLFLDAGLPSEGLSVIPASNELAEKMVRDDRPALITFTGSAKVGWYLKSVAGKKKVLLELGGNAGVIVHEDADLEQAARKIAKGGMLYSGQICISVQRVFVHQSVYKEFKLKLVQYVDEIKVGDPMEEHTDMSCQVSKQEADRVWEWIQEALSTGAKPVNGMPKRENNTIYPVIFEDVPENLRIWNEEVFGPVLCLRTYKDFDEAIDGVNNTKYGLQAGVFTRDISLIMKAFSKIKVGGLMINESPTFRVDPMPYGGIKDSGFGREGVAYAYLEYTEPRLLIVKG